MKYFTYPWALLYGFYFFLLFQIMSVVLFGGLNTNLNILDVFLYVVGVLSVLLFMYFAKKLGDRWKSLWIPFVIALPYAYIGALGGGLIGAAGILIYGLLPFIVVLSLGYWLIKRFAGK